MLDVIKDRQWVAIVDAYTGIRALVQEFRDRGYFCLRVQSTHEVPPVYRQELLDRNYFGAEIIHDGDIAATAAAVAALHPVAVVPGAEIGVEFTDLLAERLGLLGNGTALSAARRDKFLMVEAVRAAGLRAARQLRVTGAGQLAAWHRDLGGRVVVKPPRSAGSQGVFFCDTPEQSVAAYLSLAGADNIFSEPNEGAVAQEYLPGTEYVVNTASRDGRHQVCEIWHASRVSANGVLDLCDAFSLVASDNAVAGPLSSYAFAVLDALGIRHGPGHLEIRMTPAEPCLVEIGARIAGGGIPACASLAIGESQIEWTVDAYTRPDRFAERAGSPYPMRKYCAIAGLVSPVEGVLSEYRGIDEIRLLESFYDLTTVVKPGQELQRTVDDLSHPVIVTLIHEIEEIVRRDLNTIRHFDGAAFYVIDPQAGR